MFASCDKLEAHPLYYTREQIPVTMVTQDDRRQLNAWIYFLKDFKPELLNKEYIDDYDADGEHRSVLFRIHHPLFITDI